MDQDDETSIRRGTYYGTYDEQVAKALRERHRTASALARLNSGSSGVATAYLPPVNATSQYNNFSRNQKDGGGGYRPTSSMNWSRR